jgi:hypothetical protein
LKSSGFFFPLADFSSITQKRLEIRHLRPCHCVITEDPHSMKGQELFLDLSSVIAALPVTLASFLAYSPITARLGGWFPTTDGANGPSRRDGPFVF